MSKFIIAFRNSGNDRIGFVTDSDEDADGSPATFSSYDDALECTDNVPILRAFPWSIIEVDV